LNTDMRKFETSQKEESRITNILTYSEIKRVYSVVISLIHGFAS